MNTPRWHYVEMGGTEVRWRHDGQEHANPSSGYEIETHNSFTGEWTEVRNYNSRDWFAIGMMARREMGKDVAERVGVATDPGQEVLAL